MLVCRSFQVALTWFDCLGVSVGAWPRSFLPLFFDLLVADLALLNDNNNDNEGASLWPNSRYGFLLGSVLI